MPTTDRRTAIKTLGALGASLAVMPESWAKIAALNAPIKLGVIADLHGGLGCRCGIAIGCVSGGHGRGRM